MQYEAAFTFNLSINREVLVDFGMSTQDKHPSHIPSAGQNNPLVYKLAKDNNPREPNNYRIHHHINLQTQKNINSQTHHPNNSRYINSSTYNPINSQTQKKRQPINVSAHKHTSSKLINLQTHQLKKLKLSFLFYNTTLIFTPF